MLVRIRDGRPSGLLELNLHGFIIINVGQYPVERIEGYEKRESEKEIMICEDPLSMMRKMGFQVCGCDHDQRGGGT